MTMKIASSMPEKFTEMVIRTFIQGQLKKPSTQNALRFLFRLDNFIYFFQGEKSVEYGKGVHTKHRHTRYHDFFSDNIKSGERVLDIGCGIGALSYDIAHKTQAYVVGIDQNPKNIAQACQRYAHPQVRYIVADAHHNLPDGPFNVAILSNVLEHLTDRPAFLRRIQELVCPSRYLIRVPLFERDWRVPLKQELGVEWRLDPTHETEYTLESFAEEMTASGLIINHQAVRWGEIWAITIPKR